MLNGRIRAASLQSALAAFLRRWYALSMSTLAEIEAALPSLSPEELAQVESTLRRLQREHGFETRFDGQPWPTTPREVTALLAELDSLPPLLNPEEAERLDAWRAEEKRRQKALSAAANEDASRLFE